MEHLNQTFFLWLNAPEHPNALVVTLATFCAEWLIWAVPILIGIGWLRGNANTRKALSCPPNFVFQRSRRTIDSTTGRTI